MKFLTVLAALVIQCAAKSWSSDSYSEETFFVFSWLSYMKRFSIIALMLSSVILYYVPESRPHARRICYTLIDVTANGLKSALSTRESEFLYEKIKSKYQRARYEHPLGLQKQILQEVTTDDENLGIVQKNSIKKSKVFVSGDDALGSKEKKKSSKAIKERRQSRQRLRNSGIKDVEPCTEITKPVLLYTKKSDDYSKYTKKNTQKNVVSTKGSSSAVENYAFLISGSPQQIAMIDQKYDKDDVVIVQDPYLKLEYKECGTTTDKVSSKASSSEQEGPTRDHDYNMTEPGMEAYMKEIELNSMPGSNIAKYSVTNSLNDGNQYCGGACCGSNGCCFLPSRFSNKDLHSKAQATIAPLDVNVLKSSRSMVNPKSYKSVEEANKNLYVVDYNHYNPEGDRIRKPMNVSNTRKVEFRNDLNNHDKVRTQKHEEIGPKIRKKKFQNNDVKANLCCTNYHTEADDETPQFGKLNLDAKSPNLLFRKSSDDSIFDFDFYNEPLLKNRLKPALVRAVNWIFGGCPEASRRAKQNREVGKEENRGLSDEWLL